MATRGSASAGAAHNGRAIDPTGQPQRQIDSLDRATLPALALSVDSDDSCDQQAGGQIAFCDRISDAPQPTRSVPTGSACRSATPRH